jgi:hypothetical protein
MLAPMGNPERRQQTKGITDRADAAGGESVDELLEELDDNPPAKSFATIVNELLAWKRSFRPTVAADAVRTANEIEEIEDCPLQGKVMCEHLEP